MHSSWMRTVRNSGCRGVGSPAGTPWDQAPPWEENPLWEETPLPREGDPPGGDPPVNRMTDACENITLPQLRCGR